MIAFVRGGIAWVIFLLVLTDVSHCVRGEERGTAEALKADVAEEIQAAENVVTTSSVPDWFEPNAVYSDDVGMLFVRTVSTCLDKMQAEEALQQESLNLVNNRLDQWFGEQASERIGLAADEVFPRLVYQQRQAIRLDDDPELAKFVKAQNLADGSQYSYHVGFAQLHLDDEFRQFARQRWLEVKTTRRLLTGGMVGATLLACVAVLFGYLKLESATRGFYSRRLQTATLVITIVVLATALWLQQNFAQL